MIRKPLKSTTADQVFRGRRRKSPLLSQHFPQMSSQGMIQMYAGPMFASKTTKLISKVKKLSYGRKRCIIFKYAKDTRYSDEEVSTHDRIMMPAISCSQLMPEYERCLKYDVVAVDEGQFFPDVVQFAEMLANAGKHVIVVGLDGTFQRKPFGTFLALMAKAEKVKKITAVCGATGRPAPFTRRNVSSQEIELIGGENIYTAVSRAEYFKIDSPGFIHLSIGPVKSQKSITLIMTLTKRAMAKRRTLLITKPEGCGIDLDNCSVLSCAKCFKLPDPSTLSSYDVIGVDDAHVFENLAEWADSLANLGKELYISSLDGNTNRESFPEIVNLFPKCEKVHKESSVCSLTGTSAAFSRVLEGARTIPVSRLAYSRALYQEAVPVAQNLRITLNNL